MRWHLRERWERASSRIARRGTQSLHQRICDDLVEGGVGSEASVVLAEELEARLEEFPDSAYPALLAGAVAAVEMHQRAEEAAARNAKELKEVERLMGAFAGELTKLDEVVEVLAAYVRRMRSSTPRTIERVLH